MLREVAALVHAQLREYDFLARYAGDEFVAIVPDLAGPQVDELRERIERVVSGFSINVRAQGKAREVRVKSVIADPRPAGALAAGGGAGVPGSPGRTGEGAGLPGGAG